MPAPTEGEDGYAQWRARVAAIYDDAFVSRLIERYQFARSVSAALFGEILRDAALIYLSDKTNLESPKTLKDRQRKIVEIRKLAGKLETEINSLNRLDEELFWRPQRNEEFGILALALNEPPPLIQPELTLEELGEAISHNRDGQNPPVGIPQVVKSPYGHTIRRIQIGNGHAVFWLDETQIMEAITILQNLARHAAARIAYVKGRGGAPPHFALRTWVASIESLWMTHLGRRFTYSRKDGGSPGFHFCAEVMAPLDSEVTSSALATAMRGAIRLTRKVQRDGAAQAVRENPAS